MSENPAEHNNYWNIPKYCPGCETVHSGSERCKENVFEKFAKLSPDEKLDDIYALLKTIQLMIGMGK